MPVSDEDLDELVERAAEEIWHAREAGKHPVLAVTARAYGVDR
jgi:protocatechuate 3,4-dioxygenase beta subunit